MQDNMLTLEAEEEKGHSMGKKRDNKDLNMLPITQEPKIDDII